MPYKTDRELPGAVKDNLPRHAQDIWREAYDGAYDEYGDPKKRRSKESNEATAARAAWAAVEREYHKDAKTGEWKKGASR